MWRLRSGEKLVIYTILTSVICMFAIIGMSLFGGESYQYSSSAPAATRVHTDDLAEIIRSSNSVAPSIYATYFGRKWYVAPNGRSENSGNSPHLPLANINQALKLAAPGDTIYLLPGKYREQISTSRSGSQQLPIRIVGQGEVHIVSSRPGRAVSVRHSNIWLSHLIVDGQRDTKAQPNSYSTKLVYVESPDGVISGVLLKDLKLQNAGDECIRIRGNASRVALVDLTITNCGIRDFVFHEGGKNGEGIYIGTAPEQLHGRAPDHTHTIWLHNLQITTNANECVDFKEGASRNLVESVTCSGQLDPESAAFDSRGSQNLFIANLVKDARGSGFRFGGDTPQDGVDNVAKFNRIERVNSGFKVVTWPQGEICGNSLEEGTPFSSGTFQHNLRNFACH